MKRRDDERKSRHDHNIVPGAQSALNVRASKERLPFATWETRMVLTMPGWDGSPRTSTTVADRQAARDRLAVARATFPTTRVGKR